MKPVFYLLICLGLLGCGQGQKIDISKTADQAISLESAPKADYDTKPAQESVAGQGRTQPDVSEKKIIKEGEVTFETTDLAATQARVTSSLKKLGGYIESENQQSSEYSSKTITLAVRVPSANFDLFLKNLSAKEDQIIEKNIRVRDVTAQYIDNKTRLENRKLLENRYLQLLQKASNVADVLEIENKLSEIRTDIESQQGQLNYLLKQVQYSSLSITFFVKSAAETDPGFAYRVRQSFSESIDVVSGIFFGIIHYWPLILLVLIAVVFWRNYRSKKSIGLPKTKS